MRFCKGAQTGVGARDSHDIIAEFFKHIATGPTANEGRAPDGKCAEGDLIKARYSGERFGKRSERGDRDRRFYLRHGGKFDAR